MTCTSSNIPETIGIVHNPNIQDSSTILALQTPLNNEPRTSHRLISQRFLQTHVGPRLAPRPRLAASRRSMMMSNFMARSYDHDAAIDRVLTTTPDFSSYQFNLEGFLLDDDQDPQDVAPNAFIPAPAPFIADVSFDDNADDNEEVDGEVARLAANGLPRVRCLRRPFARPSSVSSSPPPIPDLFDCLSERRIALSPRVSVYRK